MTDIRIHDTSALIRVTLLASEPSALIRVTLLASEPSAIRLEAVGVAGKQGVPGPRGAPGLDATPIASTDELAEGAANFYHTSARVVAIAEPLVADESAARVAALAAKLNVTGDTVDGGNF